MIYGLQVYSTESDAKLPFSIIGGPTNACYTHKWYQTLDGINLINKEIKYACELNGLNTNYLKLYSKYFIKIFEYLR
jgi:hypothetical protein